jgi:hypothetical protein
MRTLLITLLGIALCTACTPADGNHVTRTDTDILEALVGVACRLDTREIISDEPLVGAGTHYGLDLSTRRPERARWPRDKVCPTVRVARNSIIQAALEEDTASPPPWTGFKSRFDGAATLLRVSLPVYSEDGRRAVVYTSSTCPYRCGAGFFHELVKTPAGWRIANSVPAWTS